MYRIARARFLPLLGVLGLPSLLYTQTVKPTDEMLADYPRWTVENRQFVDRPKPAISSAETSEFYFVPSSVRKSVCTFVRQLRGPHLST